MKNKIIALGLVAFVGICLAPTIFANSQGDTHRTYPEFKQVTAKNTKLVKKETVRGSIDGVKVKPTDRVRPPKPEPVEEGEAEGELGAEVIGNKYAIVIGIADYPGEDFDLWYTDDDALEMVKVLTEVYKYDEANIHTFIDVDGEGTVNATRENIINAVEILWDSVEAGDEVTFFFSGHGMGGEATDGDVEVYDESIIVHDGTANVPIWDGELKTWFEDFPTDRIIFIFDSCLAGGMNDLAAPGRIINMATTETGTAYEFSYLGDGHGQFSYYFVVAGILQGQADVYDHGYRDLLIPGADVTIEEAFDYAKDNYLDTGRYKRLKPTISDSFLNDLLL